MAKFIIKFACFTLSCLSYFAFISLDAQEIEPMINIERAPVIKKTIEENILYLHNQLPELIKTLKLENQSEIIIDMGPWRKPGDKTSYIYVEKARVKFTGNTLSEVMFSYTRSNIKTLAVEARQFLNINPLDQTCKDLKVIYTDTRGETEEFNVGTISNDKEKTRILRTYLSNLNEFVRWLNFYSKKNNKNPSKILKKALLVGAA